MYMYNCYMYAAGYIFKSVLVFISLHVYMYSYMMYNLLDLNLCTRVPEVQYSNCLYSTVCVHLFSCRGSRHSSVAEREHRAFQYLFFYCSAGCSAYIYSNNSFVSFRLFLYMYSPSPNDLLDLWNFELSYCMSILRTVHLKIGEFFKRQGCLQATPTL
jgi:hypothetical protein